MRPVVSYSDLASENSYQNDGTTVNVASVSNLQRVDNSSFTQPALAGSDANGNIQRGQPPPKKRRRGAKGRNTGGGGGHHRTNGNGQGNAGWYAAPTQIKHWDDPDMQGGGLKYEDGEVDSVAADGSFEGGDMYEEEEEEESRELTHGEIWDDSALIAAWDAANEEYEVRGRIHRVNRLLMVLVFLSTHVLQMTMMCRQCMARTNAGSKSVYIRQRCKSIQEI